MMSLEERKQTVTNELENALETIKRMKELVSECKKKLRKIEKMETQLSDMFDDAESTT